MNRLLLSALALGLFAGLAAADERDAFLKRVPDQANGLSWINVAAIYASPLAQREGWGRKQEIADVVPMPGFVDQVMTASHWNPGSIERGWMIVQASLTTPADMQELAMREKTKIETIYGHRAVLSKQRGYFVELDPKVVGLVYPPNRLDTIRWLRQARSSTKPVISAYLLETAKSDSNAHVVGAVDLEGLIDPTTVKEWLAHSKSMAKHKGDVDTIAKVAASCKGARLTIRLDDQAIHAEVRLEFSDNFEQYASLIKPVFLEALQEMGFYIEEFETAETSWQNNSVFLRTKLASLTFGRVLASILGPTLPPSSPGESASGADAELTASKLYYSKLDKYLSDLREYYKSAKNYAVAANWHETNARLLDQLPQANVDPELLKSGNEVGSKLRLLATSMRGVPLKLQLLEGQKVWAFQYVPPVYGWPGNYGPWGGWHGYSGGVYPGAGGYPGWWGFRPGGFRYDDNFPVVQAHQMRAIAEGAMDREKIWREIDDIRSRTRSAMSQKFKVEF